MQREGSQMVHPHHGCGPRPSADAGGLHLRLPSGTGLPTPLTRPAWHRPWRRCERSCRQQRRAHASCQHRAAAAAGCRQTRALAQASVLARLHPAGRGAAAAAAPRMRPRFALKYVLLTRMQSTSKSESCCAAAGLALYVSSCMACRYVQARHACACFPMKQWGA